MAGIARWIGFVAALAVLAAPTPRPARAQDGGSYVG